MKNSLIRCAAAGVALLSIPGTPFTAHAEGGVLTIGGFGANRRVTSTAGPNQSIQLADGTTIIAGYVGIRANFGVPDIRLPTVAGTRNKPTFYVGSRSAGRAVDAGVQWESEPQTFNGKRVGPGWSPFINVDNDTNPRSLVDGKVVPWRSNSDTTPDDPLDQVNWNVASITFIYRIHPGGEVSLYMDASGADYQPANYLTIPGVRSGYKDLQTFYSGPATSYGRVATPVYTVNQLAGMTMKRVIGITQGGAPNPGGTPNFPPGAVRPERVYTLDGSEMIGCTIGNIYLATPVQIPGGGMDWNFTEEVVHQPLATPPVSNVDQSSGATGGTGYAPRRRDGQGNWIINFNFQGIGTRDNAGNYRNAETEARYSSWETVDVHLRSASPVEGELIKFGITPDAPASDPAPSP